MVPPQNVKKMTLKRVMTIYSRSEGDDGEVGFLCQD